MLKLCFYVPESHCEPVKQALFDAGAGKIGHYDCCSWQVKGQGQFRPLEGSDAFIGELNQLEGVDEYRVEMVLPDAVKEQVIHALFAAHPYETPAFDLFKLESI